MSRTKHSTKTPGFDYWSRRPVKSASGHAGGASGYGPDVKRLTHRAERRQGKAQVQSKEQT